MPNEVSDPIAISKCKDTTTDASYDADAVNRFWRALVAGRSGAAEISRTGFLGKVSPVHALLGQLRSGSVTCAFRSQPAPASRGMPEACPTPRTREAYSAPKVRLAGFWPGGGPVDYPAFYRTPIPRREDFPVQRVTPDAAIFHEQGAGNSFFPRLRDECVSSRSSAAWLSRNDATFAAARSGHIAIDNTRIMEQCARGRNRRTARARDRPAHSH